MINPSRRHLLKTTAAGAAAALNLGFASGETFPPQDRILVLVHLRGACDALNLISPATDANFLAARTAELRANADGPAAGIELTQHAAPDIGFYLHSAAAPLAEFYRDRSLAVVVATGVPDANRSHFVATDMIERGVGRPSELLTLSSGWLARQTRALGARDLLSAVEVTAALSGDYAELPSAVAIPDISHGFDPPGGGGAWRAIAALYEPDSDEIAAIAKRTLAVAQQIRTDNASHIYAACNTTDYDRAGEFGRALQSLSTIIKMEAGLRVASIDLGGWDTHDNQPRRFAALAAKLAAGLSAFWNDIPKYHDRVTLVTISEFGRRLRSNKSNGTDHGRAGAMLVMGAGVNGGRFFGHWPGLTDEQLEEGVDLRVTTDFRQVLSEAAAYQIRGKRVEGLFPNFTAANDLGLFQA
ncbi:MAG: DUF1501 domain-containing protein [Pseudomonadota bacterium]